MTYLEDAAAILNKALTDWNQRALRNPENLRAEILDARLRIAEGFARLAAAEHAGTPGGDETATEAGARIARALRYAENGLPDGEHHKTWLIDQMVRALTGCPMITRTATSAHGEEYGYAAQGESAGYLEFIRDAGEWDEGVAP